MWSPFYDYYIIRPSEIDELTADTKRAQAMLDELPALVRVGLMNYKNATGHPWIDLVLAKGQDGNFNCSDNTWHDKFNMVAIVCQKLDNASSSQTQLAFLVEVAKMFNWCLVHEEDDTGQEDLIIWKP